MSDTLTLRGAARADMPAVARLAGKLVRLHHAFDARRFLCLEPLEPGYERWLIGELARPEAVILVAEQKADDGSLAVVGYAYGRLEPRDWNSLLDAHGALHDLFVAEEARGLGAGRALVEAMFARLRSLGAPRVVLHTAVQNEAAQRLFARAGFRPTMIEMTAEL
jgi:ribosomal protein S18 acetylase RimI-like enzyme